MPKLLRIKNPFHSSIDKMPPDSKHKEYAQWFRFIEDEAFDLAKVARACKRGKAELQKIEEKIKALPEGDNKRKRFETKKVECEKTFDKNWKDVLTLVVSIQKKTQRILDLLPKK